MPRTPEDSLAARLALWRGRSRAVTDAHSPETLGDVACGPCPSCDGPLVVTSADPLQLACPQCRTVERR